MLPDTKPLVKLFEENKKKINAVSEQAVRYRER